MELESLPSHRSVGAQPDQPPDGTIALAKENDQTSIDRLAEVESEIAELRERVDSMKLPAARETGHRRTAKAQERYREARRRRSSCSGRRSGTCRRDSLRPLARAGEEASGQERRTNETQKNGSFLREEVTEDDIAAVVSKWTGIPVERMLEGEQAKLTNMSAAARARGGPGSRGRVYRERGSPRARGPARSQPADWLVHFPGPTGCGENRIGAPPWRPFSSTTKTHVVRIDMSELHGKAQRLAPAGGTSRYVATKKGPAHRGVRRRPLFGGALRRNREGHGDVFNVFLQLLDDGRLTDGQGRTVDFRNTVIIMTSNVGSKRLMSDPPDTEGVMDDLRSTFRPEFLTASTTSCSSIGSSGPIWTASWSCKSNASASACASAISGSKLAPRRVVSG